MSADTLLLVKLILLATLVFLLPTVYVAVTQKLKAGNGFWALGLASGTAGCLIELQRGLFTEPFGMTFALAILSLALFFLLRGIERRLGRTVNLWYLIIPLTLMIGSQWLLADNYQQRSTVMSLIFGGQFLLLAAAVLTDRGNPLCKVRMLFIFAALIPGMVYMLRAIVFLMTGDMSYFAQANNPMHLFALVCVLLFIPLSTVAMLLIPQPDKQSSQP